MTLDRFDLTILERYQRDTQLPHVAQARGAVGVFPSLLERRKQQPGISTGTSSFPMPHATAAQPST